MSSEQRLAERPVIFSASMVRAVLKGRKTQTRRVMKPQPRLGRYGAGHPTKPNGLIGPLDGSLGGGDYHVWEGKRAKACLTTSGVYVALAQCPYGQPGDTLWVRESWRPAAEHLSECTGPADIRFAASVGEAEWAISKWRPSIHMPRWASRITLRITEIRIERLQQISEEDCIAEGIYNGEYDPGIADGGKPGWCYGPGMFAGTPRHAYELLWGAIHGEGSWGLNPWVWAISFERTVADER